VRAAGTVRDAAVRDAAVRGTAEEAVNGPAAEGSSEMFICGRSGLTL
jgi:hypothetical protein